MKNIGHIDPSLFQCFATVPGMLKYRKYSNNWTMCYVVRNFLLCNKGGKHTKKHATEIKEKVYSGAN